MNQLVCNAIKTPDGTVLRSFHRYDFKTHVDTNGGTYVVDGGLEYIRRSVNKIPAMPLDVYLEDPYDEVREAFCWGTYGKDPDYSKEEVQVSLSRLSNPHIKAIIETQTHIAEWLLVLFKKELLYREEYHIYIEEVESYE